MPSILQRFGTAAQLRLALPLPLLGVATLTLWLASRTQSSLPLLLGLFTALLSLGLTMLLTSGLRQLERDRANLVAELQEARLRGAQSEALRLAAERAIATATSAAAQLGPAIRAQDSVWASRSLKLLADAASSTEQFAEGVSKAQEFTIVALENALQGVSAVSSVSMSISEAAEAVNRATDTMQQLEQRSADIENIVNLIKDVADQTKLIALNAAIEAARAGTHGRGFSVVADAVRRLAEQTAQATTQISQLITSASRDTAVSVELLQQAHFRVATGVKEASHAQGTLQRIHDTADQMVQTIDTIAEATHQVMTANGEATDLIKNIVAGASPLASTKQ